MNKKAMAAAVSMILAGGAHGAQNEHPNVIVIIADDMGYSDISPFGGEIPTPNLQAMAEQSIRMSQYYTSPMSAPALPGAVKSTPQRWRCTTWRRRYMNSPASIPTNRWLRNPYCR